MNTKKYTQIHFKLLKYPSINKLSQERLRDEDSGLFTSVAAYVKFNLFLYSAAVPALLLSLVSPSNLSLVTFLQAWLVLLLLFENE